MLKKKICGMCAIVFLLIGNLSFSIYSHINKLQTYNSIQIPSYDYKTHTRNQKTTKIVKTPIIIIEGIFSLYYKKIRYY